MIVEAGNRTVGEDEGSLARCYVGTLNGERPAWIERTVEPDQVLSDLTRYVNLNMASRRETEGAGHTAPGVTPRRITKVACLLAPAALSA